MTIKGHLKHLLFGGAALLAVLLVLGVDWRQALQWAALAACPLMMLVMMGRGHGGEASPPDHGSHHPVTTAPRGAPDVLEGRSGSRSGDDTR